MRNAVIKVAIGTGFGSSLVRTLSGDGTPAIVMLIIFGAAVLCLISKMES